MPGIKSKKSNPANGKPATGKNSLRVNTRIAVKKTYKLYIGGKFPRSESGRYLKVNDSTGNHIANISRASRKDFRDAVVASGIAFRAWSKASAFNRGQILYRIAEMLEGRKEQFVTEQVQMGIPPNLALRDVEFALDRLVHYAGWADKFQQVFSSVNPVSSSYFNFSMLEPMGTVGLIAPQDRGLLGLVSTIAPVICGGNAAIVFASESNPLIAMSFAEVLHTSDLTGGVVNLLTGLQKELGSHFSSHMDINALVYCGNDEEESAVLEKKCAGNVKRFIKWCRNNWEDQEAFGPYFISDLQETKTTWHPVGI